jgi:hypothetical protein
VTGICGERGDGFEEPTNHFHKWLEGEAIENIRNILEYGGKILVGQPGLLL